MKRILEVKKKIGTLSKQSKNPFFKSAYLNLNDLLSAVEPLLQEQGLILVQPIIDGAVCTQILDPEDGKCLLSSFISIPDIKDPQKLGSAITYFRRYTLKSLLAIAEDDDDGNKASKPTPVKPVEKPKFTSNDAKREAEKKTTIEELKKRFDLTEAQEIKYETLIK